MRLVVGLGNPGAQYECTPHNLGFRVVDLLAARSNLRISRPDSKALIGLNGNLILAKPQTYMNLSGWSVAALLDKYSLSAADLILVYDELALPWGQLRIRPRGSSGGHNGVKSVMEHLGTDEFIRVRLGIHPGYPVASGSDFVLAAFPRQQMKELDELSGFAADAVSSIIAEGVEKSMTRFNRRAPGLTTEEA